MGLSEDRRCAVNCVKCKLPIRAGEIVVRIDSQNMSHGQCAASANLSVQPQAQSVIGVVEKIVDGVPHINGTGRPGDVWLQTHLGRQLRVPEWNHDAICLEETAYVLSGIHRFGARTDPYYTVAEHSVRVADCIALLGGSALEQFVGINHEGDEALLGFDPASPLLRLLPDLKALKRLAHESYMRRYGLPIELPAIVKHADLVLLATERRDLMKGGEFVNMTEMPEPLKSKIVPWPNPYARFVQRWRELAQAAGYQGKE